MELTAFEKPKSLETDVAHWGRYTMRIPPQIAPVRLPRPPTTAPAMSAIERLSGNPSGFTVPVERASSAPPSPAHDALTTKASTWVRATLIPASDATISSSRTVRKDRPKRLRTRLARMTSVITAAIAEIHAIHSWGSKLGPRKLGGVGWLIESPVPPPSAPGQR